MFHEDRGSIGSIPGVARGRREAVSPDYAGGSKKTIKTLDIFLLNKGAPIFNDLIQNAGEISEVDVLKHNHVMFILIRR